MTPEQRQARLQRAQKSRDRAFEAERRACDKHYHALERYNKADRRLRDLLEIERLDRLEKNVILPVTKPAYAIRPGGHIEALHGATEPRVVNATDAQVTDNAADSIKVTHLSQKSIAK